MNMRPFSQRCCLLACAIAVMLVATLLPALCAYASEATVAGTDLGSITLQLGDEATGDTLKGGRISLYCVAVASDDGGLHYDVTKGQFASSASVAGIPTMSKAELDARNYELAEALEGQVTALGISPQQVVAIQDGAASFSSLPRGLYLLVQHEPSEGNRKIGAFLMSVPGEGGELNVVAKPKPGIVSSQVTPNESKGAAAHGVSPELQPDDGSGGDGSRSGQSGTGAAGGSQSGSGAAGGSQAGQSGSDSGAGRSTVDATGTNASSISLRVAQTGDSSIGALPFLLAGLALVCAGLLGASRVRGKE